MTDQLFQRLPDASVLDVDTGGDQPQDEAALEQLRRDPLAGLDANFNAPLLSGARLRLPGSASTTT